jgi:sugar O-acyltransferase (sialic acid O-acetyltransferase NeuD family)
MDRGKRTKRTPIVIIGAHETGHVVEVLALLEAVGGYEVMGFLDNSPRRRANVLQGIKVLGAIDDLEALCPPPYDFHIAIGDNFARGDVFRHLKELGRNVITLTHPKAIVSKAVVVGAGCYIGPGAIIGSAVNIGEASIIDAGSIIHHDTSIGHAVYMSAGAKTASRVHIDDYSFIGLGAVILPDIRIGSGVMIGAGSVVTDNVPSGKTMVIYASKEHTKNIYVDVEPDIGQTKKVYVAQPTVPNYSLLDAKFQKIVESRMLSNFAEYSSQLELNIQGLLSVKSALTFPNCTSALMLALKILGLKGEELGSG